jgi:ribosomal-protein-alanine N-acetyltransferase
MPSSAAAIPADLRLRTPRLCLRPLADGDAPLLWPYVTDPELPRFMTWDPHTSLDETNGIIAATIESRQQGVGLACVIEHDGALAGVVGLHDITRTLRAWRVDRAELGYWVAPPFQNRGFVTEAARALVGYGFDQLALHKLTVGCISENLASRRVIEKLGFRLLGEQRDHMFRFGRWWNHLSFEMCADERPDYGMTGPPQP